jgi:hypothetical protein
MSGAQSLVRRFFGDFLGATRKSLACRGETRRDAASAAKAQARRKDRNEPTAAGSLPRMALTSGHPDTAFR